MNDQEVEDNDDEDAADLLVPPPEEGFGVRRPLRETNWLYRSDSLRPNHVFEAVTFFGVAEHLLSLSQAFFIYGASIATYSRRLFANGLRAALSTSARTLAFVSFTVASWLLSTSRVTWLPCQRGRFLFDWVDWNSEWYYNGMEGSPGFQRGSYLRAASRGGD
jgi:hypothetical protein